MGLSSHLSQVYVAADRAGAQLDVVLVLAGLADAGQVVAHVAGDRVDVGPHRRTGRDADTDVAGNVLGGDLPARGGADGEVARGGGQGDVALGAVDLEIAGAG